MKKVAFVTGGSRGIGLGIAQHLAQSGFNLAINGVRDEQSVEEVLLTSGEITNTIDGNGSYVLVEKAAEINKLMLGDVVKVEHDRCPEGYYSLLGSCHKNLSLF